MSRLSGESREGYNARMAAYMKIRYEQRRAEAVAALGGHCAQCLETEDLQFDHIDPATKTMTIAKMWTASEIRFQAELAKCQLLCVSHHRKKTFGERGFTEVKGQDIHGTLSAARYCRSPRCEECKRACREYVARWRASRAPLAQRKSYSLLRRRPGFRNSHGAPWASRATWQTLRFQKAGCAGSNPASPT